MTNAGISEMSTVDSGVWGQNKAVRVPQLRLIIRCLRQSGHNAHPHELWVDCSNFHFLRQSNFGDEAACGKWSALR